MNAKLCVLLSLKKMEEFLGGIDLFAQMVGKCLRLVFVEPTLFIFTENLVNCSTGHRNLAFVLMEVVFYVSCQIYDNVKYQPSPVLLSSRFSLINII